MKIFFDTSAWVKRYVEESGSDEVELICQQADDVILSILCVPETISTFSRLLREKKLTKSMFSELKHIFAEEIEDVKFINITPDVINKSAELLQNYFLRTLDALHIACALNTQIDLFVTSDLRQKDATQQLGLKVHYV